MTQVVYNLFTVHVLIQALQFSFDNVPIYFEHTLSSQPLFELLIVHLLRT